MVMTIENCLEHGRDNGGLVKTSHDVIGLIYVNNVIQQCHTMPYNVMHFYIHLIRFNWDLNPDLRSVGTPRRAYYTSEP